MEIKLSVKQPGRADVNFEFSCNAEEAAVLINDPVYQQLGMVLVDYIKMKNEQLRNRQKQQKCNNHYQQQMDIMKHNLNVLEKRIDAFKSHL